jgi:hypothetical protein
MRLLALCFASCSLLLFGCRSNQVRPPTIRTMSAVTVDLALYQNGKEIGMKVEPHFPQDSRLWARYSLSWDSTSETTYLGGRTAPCGSSEFQACGFSDISECPVVPRTSGEPVRIIFDYEIWNGKPPSGELLIKSYASSQLYRIDDGQVVPIDGKTANKEMHPTN